MLYAILATDRPDSLGARRSARERHLARLETLQAEGRLIVAGPHPAIDSETPGEAGFSGSLIVAEFTDLTEARDWAEADPYVESGAYESVDVKPFKLVFPR